MKTFEDVWMTALFIKTRVTADPLAYRVMKYLIPRLRAPVGSAVVVISVKDKLVADTINSSVLLDAARPEEELVEELKTASWTRLEVLIRELEEGLLTHRAGLIPRPRNNANLIEPSPWNVVIAGIELSEILVPVKPEFATHNSSGVDISHEQNVLGLDWSLFEESDYRNWEMLADQRCVLGGGNCRMLELKSPSTFNYYLSTRKYMEDCYVAAC